MPETQPEPLLPTPLQQGMLFHSLFAPGSGVDIEQVIMTFSQSVEISFFQQAWEAVVRRHAILRSCFNWNSPSFPLQVVQEEVNVPWRIMNWMDVRGIARQEKLDKFLEEDRYDDFPMDRAPLMRLSFIQFEPQLAKCVWTFHHAILDGRSFPILLSEVFAEYSARAAGERVPSFPERVPFEQFQRFLHERSKTHEESFWRNELQGFTAPTPVPEGIAWTPVERAMGFEGKSGSHSYGPQIAKERLLSKELTDQLHATAEEFSVTLNTLLQGTWALWLSHTAGPTNETREIVFGATRACRHSSVPGAEGMVGLLINTLPLRVRWDAQTLTRQFFQEVRRKGLALRAVEHSSLSDVQRWSEIPAGLPLFETLVVFEKGTLNDQLSHLGPNCSFEYRGKTSFPLALIAYGGNRLLLRIEADSQRFSEASVERIMGYLEELLTQLYTHREATVDSIPYLPQTEIDALLRRSRMEPKDDADIRTLHERFEASVREGAERIAVTVEGTSVSYGELNRRANRLAHLLRSRGVGPDVLVGLATERNLDVIVGILGILKAGGAYVPIDLAYPAQRLAFMLEDSQAPILLTQRTLVAQLPPTNAVVICLDDPESLIGFPDHNPEVRNAPGDLAYVIYTSGSTGAPKGALVTHENVTRLFTATDKWFGFQESDVWTLFHSYAFDFSVWEIWGALLYGGRLIVVPYLVSRSPEEFYTLLSQERVTVLNQTPSAFRQLIQAEGTLSAPLPLSLRYVIFGGEALEMQSLKPWFDRHGDQQPRLINMYGITETTVHVTYRPLSADDLGRGSVIGVPISDLQIYILDPYGRPVPIGVPGEMFVGGKGLARGYLNRQELTAQRFIPHPFDSRPDARLYRTGDLARFLPDGDIEYLGRIDQQVKIRGFRIELGEIESVLSEHPAVSEVVVTPRDDHRGEKRLVAHIVCQKIKSEGNVGSNLPSHSQLRDHLKGKLPEYMVPSAFVFMDKLPLTNNGKVDRKALPDPVDQRPELAHRFVVARTPVEEQLVQIWRDVLRLERVGVHDNYFEIGGDSIQSTLIVSAARRVGLQITPRQLFASPTIAQLATVAVSSLQVSPRLETSAEGDCPLTPIQHWFFEQQLADPHHYNQAFMFEVDSLRIPEWKRAMAAVEAHHDALRLRFRFENGKWHQAYKLSDSDSESWATTKSFVQTVLAPGETLPQASDGSDLDIERGPLWRVHHFLLADGTERLLVTVHHLAMDGVSWRILLEDLERAYFQACEGEPIALGPKTTSFKGWGEQLQRYAKSSSLKEEQPYWELCVQANAPSLPLDLSSDPQQNTEASVQTIKVSLTEEETQLLLQQVPQAYNTLINDVLLTALARGVESWTNQRRLRINLEGHGREDLFEGVDVTRTVGWFTSIFPVLLELPDSGEPQAGLKAIKEQLRAIPRRGLGYGVSRYLTDELGQPSPLCVEPEIVFNYLGKFDDVLRGSRLLQFASESSGPWHSPRQKRRHILEINCMILHERLEVAWSYSSAFHHRETMDQAVKAFLKSLREIIRHCVDGSRGSTPSDFPLCGLDQVSLDRLLQNEGDVEDVYPPSPLQVLFLAQAARSSQTVLDQWQCLLTGDLDLSAFQSAWQQAIDRHQVLRTHFRTEGTETRQIVRRHIVIPWKVDDWSEFDIASQDERWKEFLKDDRAQGLTLDHAPLSRFAIVRMGPRQHRFVWTVPALHLDGWSWPLVFADVSKIYQAILRGEPVAMPQPLPYRDYLKWLGEHSAGIPKSGLEHPRTFWERNLDGISEPTPLPSEQVSSEVIDKDPFERLSFTMEETTVERLLKGVRSQQVTVSALLQTAWSMVLSRLSNRQDVLFGAAFSGRPTDLVGAESMVGPFVNNVPVRVQAVDSESLGNRLIRVHQHLLSLHPFQFVSSSQIQSWSKIPWQHRLCESLVVVQNYVVDSAARMMGESVTIESLDFPIHTNFPLLVLAEPNARWKISIIFDRRVLARNSVERWSADLQRVLASFAEDLSISVDQVMTGLSPPVTNAVPKRKLFVQSQNHVPPQTATQKGIAEVWREVIRLDRVSIEDNLFDLGVHSLLVVQLHLRLQEKLGKPIGLVDLFRFPTIYALGQHLDRESPTPGGRLEQTLDRGQRQRQSMASMKNFRAKVKP